MKILSFLTKYIPTKKSFVYVALGDSTVEGIGATAPHRSYTGILHGVIKEKKKRTHYHNLGIAGATIQDVIRLQLAKAIELQPDLITLSVGANDIKKRTTTKKLSQIKKNS